MSGRFHRLRFRVSSHDEELLSAWLWALGTEGIEIREESADSSIVIATFEEKKLLVKGDLEAIASLVPSVEWIDSATVDETDWLATWRAAALPIPLGEKLLIDPREWESEPEAPLQAPEDRRSTVGASSGRFVLRIPARTAFGVGSHESTRLAYELLEATPLAGKSVLDVGCGSGILAMAALLLGAESAVAFDSDPAAALLAGQYARHNAVLPDIYAGTIAALAPAARRAAFHVVVLNVLPHEIAAELEQVIGQLAPGGDLLVSGVLASESGTVARSIKGHRCEKIDEIVAGEWVGLRFRRQSGPATATQ